MLNHLTMVPGETFTSPWRQITEEDMLYCVLFSGEGQPHTNQPYSETMPYRSRMFYGDGTLALLFSAALMSGLSDNFDFSTTLLAPKYVSPVYIGQRIRAKMTVLAWEQTTEDEADPEWGKVSLAVEGESSTNEVVLHCEVEMLCRPKAQKKG